MKTNGLRTRLVVMAFVSATAAGLSACGGEDDSAVKEDGQATLAPKPASNDGDASERMITEPLKAIGATDIEISSDSVRATFEGSRDAPTAWTKCSAMQAVVGDKDSIMIYSDGELNCADRPGA